MNMQDKVVVHSQVGITHAVVRHHRRGQIQPPQVLAGIKPRPIPLGLSHVVRVDIYNAANPLHDFIFQIALVDALQSGEDALDVDAIPTPDLRVASRFQVSFKLQQAFE
jgi:hypothetical protein